MARLRRVGRKEPRLRATCGDCGRADAGARHHRRLTHRAVAMHRHEHRHQHRERVRHQVDGPQCRKDNVSLRSMLTPVCCEKINVLAIVQQDQSKGYKILRRPDPVLHRLQHTGKHNSMVVPAVEL